MSKAPLACQMGEDYQARFFWLEACGLFQDHTKVERVAYEHTGFRAFDDVVVTYAEPIPSLADNGLVTTDYYQLKFHVDKSSHLGFESLVEPSAIGATKFSLLQRLKQAVDSYTDPQARFTLVSAAVVNPLNILADILDNKDGSVRLDVLFDGTTDASKKGIVRQSWRNNLQLVDNSDLYPIVKRLRIKSSFGTLETLNAMLNDKLSLVGLKPIDATSQTNLYDELIRKLHRRGMTEFDRDSLLIECKREGLWIGQPAGVSDRIPIGIQSFTRFAEHLETETERLLSLLDHFEARKIKENSFWASRVIPDVRRFLAANIIRGRRYLLHLDAHASVALLIGSSIDTKSGIDIAIVQRGASGTSIWESRPRGPAVPVVHEIELSVNDGGSEMALAIGVTKEISADVVAYARATLPSVGKVVLIEPLGGPNQAAVLDGDHAFRIAEDAVRVATRHRAGSPGIVHLFASAPNALLFFFGRMSGVLGKTQFYEHQFGSGMSADYEPSIIISAV